MTTCKHTRATLFRSREHGYHHCRVPACCVSPGGVALAFSESRRNGRGGEPGGHGDYWDIDAQLRRSADGESWSEIETIIDHADFGDGPIHNLVPIADPERGCVHLLFCHDYRRLFLTRSDDDGRSWSTPRELGEIPAALDAHGGWNAIGVGVGHGLCLRHGVRAGRLLAPMWVGRTDGDDPHRPSDLRWIRSDDGGVSWQLSEILIAHDARAEGGATIGTPSETSIAELGDGSVVFNVRNESAALRRVQLIGADGGERWSSPRFVDDLVDPQCHGSLIAIPDREAAHGTALLFANPANLDQTMPGAQGRVYDRKRLSLFRSRDAGRSWQAMAVIEAGASGYSDLALLPDGRVLCVFECGALGMLYDTDHLAAELIELAD